MKQKSKDEKSRTIVNVNRPSCYWCGNYYPKVNLELVDKTILKPFGIKDKSIESVKICSICESYMEFVNDLDSLFNYFFPESHQFGLISIKTLKTFIKALGTDRVSDSFGIAIDKFCHSKVSNKEEVAIRYFCGICWRNIKSKILESERDGLKQTYQEVLISKKLPGYSRN